MKRLYPLLLLVCSSCTTTYRISTESLVKQMADTHAERKHDMIYAYPLYIPTSVNGNSLRDIEVIDQHGQQRTVQVSNKTGIRLIRTDGKRTSFYLNTLQINDSVLTGKQDHYFGFNIKPVHLSRVVRIEVLKTLL